MRATTDDDPYAHVAKGPLKLKNDQNVIKKKKNKEGKKKKLVEVTKITEEEQSKVIEIKRTKAEIAFQKMQEKMQTERIKQKASMTHKQRVEEFNRHLDSLTEHFDIPKVSWTK
ncbi:protein FAM32A [Bombus vosnesenskii]|uniref:Protein FAM32A n=2 Tax=Pyrobombus TaxID=144703 RepID=A0A6J3L4S6_9HYME|nr:protein FAM32A [Bombus vancouverensis nearcticus]XP_033305227.1 protein FAM32A [Bombus bifarius]XP_033359471.1 protein FAM32A [Bombus vosnesenskii]XP_050485356.1 protein FAM32A [Bombus huntii]